MPFHGLLGHYGEWLIDKDGERVKDRAPVLGDALVGHGGYLEVIWCRFCGGWAKAKTMTERAQHLHGLCQKRT